MAGWHRLLSSAMGEQMHWFPWLRGLGIGCKMLLSVVFFELQIDPGLSLPVFEGIGILMGGVASRRDPSSFCSKNLLACSLHLGDILRKGGFGEIDIWC